jgi:hypothetical protein
VEKGFAWSPQSGYESLDANGSADAVGTAMVAGLERVDTGGFSVQSFIAQASPSLYGSQKTLWRCCLRCSELYIMTTVLSGA